MVRRAGYFSPATVNSEKTVKGSGHFAFPRQREASGGVKANFADQSTAAL